MHLPHPVLSASHEMQGQGKLPDAEEKQPHASLAPEEKHKKQRIQPNMNAIKVARSILGTVQMQADLNAMEMCIKPDLNV